MAGFYERIMLRCSAMIAVRTQTDDGVGTRVVLGAFPACTALPTLANRCKGLGQLSLIAAPHTITQSVTEPRAIESTPARWSGVGTLVGNGRTC